MLQYIIYFLIGGSVVTAVAYVGSRGNGILAAVIASLPILFSLNVFLICRNGGIPTTLAYVKGSLSFVPAFVCYAALTVWLLPHLGVVKALLAGLPVYLLPVMIRRVLRPEVLKTKGLSTETSEEVIQ